MSKLTEGLKLVREYFKENYAAEKTNIHISIFHRKNKNEHITRDIAKHLTKQVCFELGISENCIAEKKLDHEDATLSIYKYSENFTLTIFYPAIQLTTPEEDRMIEEAAREQAEEAFLPV